MSLINPCCDKKHLINIKNVQQNGEIHYTKFLLLCGNVSSLCTNSNHSNIISINNQLNSFVNNYNVSLINRQFKCLIKLNHGINNIHIQYGTTIEEINVVANQKTAHQNYTINLLYIVCDGHDGNFQSPESENTKEIACRKIEVGIQLIQCLLAEKLNEQKFGRRSFITSGDCETFYSKLSVDKARSMTQHELWNFFAHEIVAKYPTDDHTKFVAFLGCTKYESINTDNSSTIPQKIVTGNVALGGGNLALFGTGCLYTWPSNICDTQKYFLNQTRVDVTKFMDDSNGRQTFGGCFATTLGSVCHEIGHILDLGHTKTGIMGDGFDYVNRVFTIDNITEELPGRIIIDSNNDKNIDRFTNKTKPDKRLTNIKSGSQFLQKYQLQKDNDLTFFERNSAITLFYHKWIRNYAENISNEIIINLQQRKITSIKCALRLIEFRLKSTGLMKYFFEFVDKNLFEFDIPEFIDLEQLDFILVDDNGNIKKNILNDAS